MIYAGIGPRNTPAAICSQMSRAAQTLGKLGYTLRSGGAQGADQAFQQGSELVNGSQDIIYASDCTPEARAWAGEYHSNWTFVLPHARNLLGRNTQILFGRKLDTKVDFVFTWYRDGAGGGTGHALRIADAHKIPVFNLETMSHQDISEGILLITERIQHARSNS